MTVNFAYYKTSPFLIFIVVTWMSLSWGFSIIENYGWEPVVGPLFIISIFFLLYDTWLWKYPILKMTNFMPNIEGNYIGEINFYREGKYQSKSCRLSIKQTCSSVKVSSHFSGDDEPETRSTSIESYISTDRVGDQTLYIYYHNDGSSINGNTLEQHDGVNILHIQRNGKDVILEGRYFTNRSPQQTKGTMKVSKVLSGDKL